VIFGVFGVGVLSFGSATAYIEHQICTQKAWIISGGVVDMPFGVSDLPQNNGTPMKDHQTPIIFRFQKFVFYSTSDAEKFADFNGTIIFEIRQKWRRYRKNVISV